MVSFSIFRETTKSTFKKNCRSKHYFLKVFACLVLERIELQLDDHRPEEQHGFRRGKRIEEHLLTANAFLDKTFAVFFFLLASFSANSGLLSKGLFY